MNESDRDIGERIKVTFTGEGDRTDYNNRRARSLLELGKEYEIFSINVGSFYTSYQLVGIASFFNSLMFSPCTETVFYDWPYQINGPGHFYFDTDGGVNPRNQTVSLPQYLASATDEDLEILGKEIYPDPGIHLKTDAIGMDAPHYLTVRQIDDHGQPFARMELFANGTIELFDCRVSLANIQNAMASRKIRFTDE